MTFTVIEPWLWVLYLSHGSECCVQPTFFSLNLGKQFMKTLIIWRLCIWITKESPFAKGWKENILMVLSKVLYKIYRVGGRKQKDICRWMAVDCVINAYQEGIEIISCTGCKMHNTAVCHSLMNKTVRVLKKQTRLYHLHT